MPRTPAPLTVRHHVGADREWTIVEDPTGMLIASFREPADARAFVALPAKDEALKVLAGWAGGAIKVFHMEQFDDTVNIDAEDWGHTTPFDTCSHSACSSVRAALAQADGPSPKE